jgi:hypothetical protein
VTVFCEMFEERRADFVRSHSDYFKAFDD